KHKLDTLSRGMYWVGVVKSAEAGTPALYSLGHDQDEIVGRTASLDGQVLPALRKALANIVGEVKIRIRGDRALPHETVRAVTEKRGELERALNEERGGARRITFTVTAEVSEPKR